MATRTFSAAFSTENSEPHAVLAFREEHRLGRPAEATITVQQGEYTDPESVIGDQAQLSFETGDDGPEHKFAGIVEGVTVIGTTDMGKNSVQHMRFHVVSRMFLLGNSVGCQIFQDMTVKDIVAKVLQQNGIPAKMVEWKLTGSYPKREYCVQYNESALDFVSRLLEQEGIFYRSEAGDEGEKIIFADDSTVAPPLEGDNNLPFRQRMGLEIDKDAVYAISERRRVVSGKFVLRDYDFKRPKLDLTSTAESDVATDLEVYDFPGEYVEPAEGKRLAKVRLEAEQAERSTLEIRADCIRLAAGKKLKIHDAIHDEINGEYVLTGVVHQMGMAGAASNYHASATLIPAKIKYRSPRVTDVPLIDGPQTARVVAPAGAPIEEIHTDEHGRCKVKFHWDLGPDHDDKASCWMRVGQLQSSGSMTLPRIGWEVIVEFLEGNPDRPMVTGRLYNGAYMPPYQLPEGKTRTSLLTNSTPGGGGSNEIRFEDKAGSEEIRVQAQYDQTITTTNNKKTTIGNNQTKTVKVDTTTTVGANQDVKVTKGAQSAIGADQSITVGGNRNVEVNAVNALNVGATSTTSVGGNQFEMDGNPLKALLDLAAEKAAEIATAKADEVLGKVNSAVSDKVNQVMGPINAVAGKVSDLGHGMQAVANGDLGAAAPLLANASGLPMPTSLASAIGGGGGEEGGGGGEGGEGGEGGGEAPSPTAQLGLDAAVHNAMQSGTHKAADALGKALGLDSDGGGGASGENDKGPVGDVDGVDAEDRAKGPGHGLSKITGSHTEKVGALKVTAALTGVNTNISGNMNDKIGAARIEMALGNRAEQVDGNKTENALGLVIYSKADETEKVTASKTTMVGGAILEKIAGGHSITASSPATFIGAFHKIEASTSITLKCGASEVVIDGSGVTMTSPIVTITALKVQMTKSVSEV